MNTSTILLTVAILSGVLALTYRFWLPRLRRFWDAMRVRAALRRLPPRERYVIECRMGLYGKPRKTLDEVGAVLKVTRERARLIEGEAMKNLGRALGAA